MTTRNQCYLKGIKLQFFRKRLQYCFELSFDQTPLFSLKNKMTKFIIFVTFLAFVIIEVNSAPPFAGCGPGGCATINQNGQGAGCGPGGCGSFVGQGPPANYGPPPQGQHANFNGRKLKFTKLN